MSLRNIASTVDLERLRAGPAGAADSARPYASAVSWGAILAGAAGAAALSLILVILGTGLGMASVSPWMRVNLGPAGFGVAAIIWLSLTQILASGMGGYLAGRMRRRWMDAQVDEVFFRDTAHGFLAWAIASLATAALLLSAMGSLLGSGIKAGATLASDATVAAVGAPGAENASWVNGSGGLAYFVDALFRKPASPGMAIDRGEPASLAGSAPGQASSTSSEVTRIFVNAIRSGNLPEDDIRYVGQMVAQRTGVARQVAEKRVTDTYAQIQARLHGAEAAAQNAAETARKASQYASLWLFVALLAGAFIASWAATFGGRLRDSGAQF